MGKPQIAVRIPLSLMEKLNNYVDRTGSSKTDVLVSATPTYLGCAENVPLNQRGAELEAPMKELKTLVKSVAGMRGVEK